LVSPAFSPARAEVSLPASVKKPGKPKGATRARGCVNQQPYRVRCDKETGHCYHDIGVRACGAVNGYK
jgi:hypothetical protein